MPGWLGPGSERPPATASGTRSGPTANKEPTSPSETPGAEDTSPASLRWAQIDLAVTAQRFRTELSLPTGSQDRNPDASQRVSPEHPVNSPLQNPVMAMPSTLSTERQNRGALKRF